MRTKKRIERIRKHLDDIIDTDEGLQNANAFDFESKPLLTLPRVKTTNNIDRSKPVEMTSWRTKRYDNAPLEQSLAFERGYCLGCLVALEYVLGKNDELDKYDREKELS